MLIATVALLMLGTVVSGQLADKPGDCPPPTDVGVCVDICFSDFQCAGVGKCCPTSCGGTICTRPVTMRQDLNLKVKPGNCPRPSGPWVCSSTCSFDGDCRGRLKCCKNRCGAMACTKSGP